MEENEQTLTSLTYTAQTADIHITVQPFYLDPSFDEGPLDPFSASPFEYDECPGQTQIFECFEYDDLEDADLDDADLYDPDLDDSDLDDPDLGDSDLDDADLEDSDLDLSEGMERADSIIAGNAIEAEGVDAGRTGAEAEVRDPEGNRAAQTESCPGAELEGDSSGREFDEYTFAYTVHIENRSASLVQLVERRWTVYSNGVVFDEIEGEGVAGVQPSLLPGDTFEYTSSCVIRNPVGSMQGIYVFRNGDGSFFEVKVPSFDLVHPKSLH